VSALSISVAHVSLSVALAVLAAYELHHC